MTDIFTAAILILLLSEGIYTTCLYSNLYSLIFHISFYKWYSLKYSLSIQAIFSSVVPWMVFIHPWFREIIPNTPAIIGTTVIFIFHSFIRSYPVFLFIWISPFTVLKQQNPWHEIIFFVDNNEIWSFRLGELLEFQRPKEYCVFYSLRQIIIIIIISFYQK